MKELFFGKPLYWLLWVVNIAVLGVMGSLRLHTRDFNLFITVVVALAAASVVVVVPTCRKGERITRDRFEED